LQIQAERVESKRPGRHSSVVEQLIRNKVTTTLFPCNSN
jgi:hypothetical protein